MRDKIILAVMFIPFLVYCALLWERKKERDCEALPIPPGFALEVNDLGWYRSVFEKTGVSLADHGDKTKCQAIKQAERQYEYMKQRNIEQSQNWRRDKNDNATR